MPVLGFILHANSIVTTVHICWDILINLLFAHIYIYIYIYKYIY